MIKRVLALLLTIVMVVSVTAFAQETQTTGAFPDVAKDHLNSEAIESLTEMGVINGYEDGSFKPGADITRAEFVKMLMVLNGSANINISGVVTGFPDVDASENTAAHWAISYIKTAVDLKIINGYPDGTFKPDDNVKYEEAIKMVVCYLGREQAAKDVVTNTGIALYPDAYISVGNGLLLQKNVTSAVGTYASRANVAQIIYNAKDIQKISTSPVQGGQTIITPVIGGGSYGGGGGGGGGDSEKLSLDESIERGRDWSGRRTGTVVAAGKIGAKGEKMQYFLEKDVKTREGNPKTILPYQMIVKMDKEIDDCEYILFVDKGKTRSFYDYLAHDVSVSFKYDGDDDVLYVNAIESLQERDTLGSVNSEDILIKKTTEYNTNSTEDYGIVYFDESDEKEYTIKLPKEINDINIIYNEKLVDTSETPLEINDFIPGNGTVSFVKDDNDNYKLIRITSYETYVVGKVITSGTKGIDDKYRKQQDNTTPVRLELDDREDSGITLAISNYKGEDATVSNIKAGNVLIVQRSKCGTHVNVTIYNKELSKKKIDVIDEDENKIWFEGTSKAYAYSDYYNTNVKSTLDVGIGDRVTAYLNDKDEIVWMSMAEPDYVIGYLKSAALDKTQNPPTLTLSIMTAGSPPQLNEYSVTKTTRLITTEMSGNQYTITSTAKYDEMQDFYDVLAERASAINERDGKDAKYSQNAEVAQPIRFVVENSVIEQMETMAIHEENSFTSAPLMYKYNKFKGEGADTREYSASSNATYIFVPNDRDWDKTVYKMGTASTCKEKLYNFGRYNVEPYFVPNADGKPEHKVFVIYNEDIEGTPQYTSETIIVENIIPVSNDEKNVYKITAKAGCGSSKSTYMTEAFDNKAYVLDSSFERVKEDDVYVQREIKKGDVIRFGYSPDGAVRNIELVYDISDALAARKAIAYDESGYVIADHEKAEDNKAKYYGRVGLVTDVPDTYPQYCTLSVGKDAASTNLFIGEGYEDQKVCLNTYTVEDTTETVKFEEKTMADINEGDMIYVWQYFSDGIKIKVVYAVRYEDDLLAEYNAENVTPQPEP